MPDSKPEKANTPTTNGNLKGNRTSHPSLGTKVSDDVLEKRRIGRVRAAEEFQKRVLEAGIVKHDDFKIYNGPQQTSSLSFKYFSSNYLKNDDQIFSQRQKKQLQQNLKEGKPIEDAPCETIVIDCGSRWLKVGKPIDEEPLIIPSLVSTLKKSVLVNNNNSGEADVSENDITNDEKFIENDNLMKKSLQERMRYYKKKFNPIEGRKEVIKYNTSQKNKVEKTKADNKRPKWRNHEELCNAKDTNNVCKCSEKTYCGEIAELCDASEYDIRSPMKHLLANVVVDEYYNRMSQNKKQNLQQLLSDDFYQLLKHIFFKVACQKNVKKKIILIIPDLHHKPTLSTLISVLFNQLRVYKIALMTQSQSIVYGTSITQPTTCVDIGETTTKITTVFEGLPIKNSSINLNFGSLQVTRLFGHYLKSKIQFPMEIDLNKKSDLYFLQKLREKYLTFDEGNIAVQLYTNNLKYSLEDPTVAYKADFKIFEEVFLAGLGMFYSGILEIVDSVLYSGRDISVNREVVDDYSESRIKDSSIANFSASKINKRFSELTSDEDILALAMEMKLDDIREKEEENDEEEEEEEEEAPVDTSMNVDGDEDEDEEGFNENKDSEKSKEVKKVDVPVIITEKDLNEEENGSEEEIVDLNYCPLDQAIIQSILTSVITSDLPVKIKDLYNNIILVGGGSMLPNLDMLLIDRLNIYRPAILSTNYLQGILKDLVTKNEDNEERSQVIKRTLDNYYKLQEQSNILREQQLQPNKKQKTSAANKKQQQQQQQQQVESEVVIEQFTNIRVIPLLENVTPVNVSFKGGSIFANIKIVDELYFTESDWDILGSRILRYKCLFDY
ncbi:hypothetical protein ACO0SA_004508 [Hanseniaspora valbyensis]